MTSNVVPWIESTDVLVVRAARNLHRCGYLQSEGRQCQSCLCGQEMRLEMQVVEAGGVTGFVGFS